MMPWNRENVRSFGLHVVLLFLPVLGRVGWAADGQYVNGWWVVATLLTLAVMLGVPVRRPQPILLGLTVAGVAWWVVSGRAFRLEDALRWGIAASVFLMDWRGTARRIRPSFLLALAAGHALHLMSIGFLSWPRLVSNVNHGAAFAILMLLWAGPGRDRRWWAVWLVVGAGAWAVEARAALLMWALLAVGALMPPGWLTWRMPRAWRWGLAFLALGASQTLHFPPLRTALFSTAQRHVNDAAAEERLAMWSFSFAQMSPAGMGPGAWQPAARGLLESPETSRRQPRRPHNEWIQVLVEGGVFIALAVAVAWLGAPAAMWGLLPLLMLSYPFERPELVWAMAMCSAAFRHRVSRSMPLRDSFRGAWLASAVAAWSVWTLFLFAMHAHRQPEVLPAQFVLLLQQMFPFDVYLNHWFPHAKP